MLWTGYCRGIQGCWLTMSDKDQVCAIREDGVGLDSLEHNGLQCDGIEWDNLG